MEKLRNLSLKNKIFFSTLAVILLISLVIALFTRWILISSLTSELERRGLGIAHNIAENCRESIITRNLPELTSMLFDARLGERKALVLYIFVQDKQNEILSHTFTEPFPEGYDLANPIAPEAPHSIRLLRTKKYRAYDVAVPVNEGIYQVGTVHVGIDKNHIDQLIGKLRTTFLGFVSIVTVIFFMISHYLAKYITRPITALTKISDEISRGNFDIRPDLGSEIRCWEMKNCKTQTCPAYGNTDIPCWYVDGTPCTLSDQCTFGEKINECYQCAVYKKGMRDEVRQLANSFINMTNRIKQSQVKLKESEGKYRSLFHSGPNPVFVVDHKTLEILDANPSAESTYGYSKKELIGRAFTDLGPFEYTNADLSDPDEENWQKSRIVNPKVQHFKKGNEAFYVNIHAAPARYQDRDAFIVGTTDITEMIEKDTQLIQASKMTTLGEMSAGIAHELNQPLNAIKMGSEFLKMMIERGRNIADEDLYEVSGEISGQVDRAADIINHLRDFGRKADFSKEKIFINTPIRGVLDIVGRQLTLQNIDVQLDLDESIPPILAHNNRIEQVIFNLVTNARDAINQKSDDSTDIENRSIRIRSCTENDRVKVCVRDTGIGIPEALRQRIFESFFTTKKMGEGMGLGLSIASGIVGDYGGSIDIQSTEGEGTEIFLSFPRADV